MSARELIIEGAKQNNLKNVTLRLPHNQVVVITGVSGSGKSSLAFDTVFAEGQWRFIESLSTYARLFLEKLDRPDVDAIHNVRPAIALEQKNPVKGSRSTVGTLTELYDLFRVLYSRVATPYCPKCEKEIRKWDPSQIVAELLDKYPNGRALIIFETTEPVETLKQRGFHRVWMNDEAVDMDELPGEVAGPIEVVVDRMVLRDEPRLSDSVELTWREGKENVKVVVLKGHDTENREALTLRFSSKNTCDDCGLSLPEPTPILFSFNHPVCACPECKGFGNILIYDEDLIIPDTSLSLAKGAIDLWEKPGYKWWRDQLLKGAKKSGIDVSRPYRELSKQERSLVFKGNQHFEGIDSFFEEMEGKRYKLHVRVLLSRYRSPVTCPKCGGQRLCEHALAYRIEGLDIAELTALSVSKALKWFEDLALSPMKKDIAREALRQIVMKLRFLERVGLEYLTLNRQAKTLSGGEYQRVNLSNQLASALTGTLYVLDEPTIGLHPRDTRRVAEIMRELASLGNTILVVEHDKDIISSSDWVVELGPQGGHLGGEVVFSGPMNRFLKADTLTAHCLRDDGCHQTAVLRHKTKDIRLRLHDYSLTLYHATGNNLRNATLRVPLETLTVVSGVSGSGKSSLVVETLYYALARHFRMEPEHPLPYKKIEGIEKIKGVRLIDQSPIGKTPRSNPLTYLKVFDPIRKLFSQQLEAKAHGYSPGFFSFNVPGGRCEACTGEGYQKMEMYFFEDIFVTCEECKGKRYKEEALRVRYKGRNISEVLDMTVDDAFDFFSDIAEIRTKLELMKDIGLGYLRLGQSATTLSGGEAQRLKICAELSVARPQTRGMLYILDEPTVGLHYNDVMMLMRIVRQLVDSGNTVLIIEHNLDVIEQSDWVIDLGPEGGDQGGTILFEGTPEELKTVGNSYTGQYLKKS
ncbi:MAG: excinuclease ABC subunit UvrA [Nitrospirota bacterium]